MAHSFDTKAEIGGTTNPLAANYTCGAGATLLVLTIVVGSATPRAGGAPTYNGAGMTRADTNRIAAETNCELWYFLGPTTGSALSISIPNTDELQLYTVASSYKAQAGYISALDRDIGRAVTTAAANPNLSLTPTVAGDVLVNVLGDDYNGVPSAYTGTLLYSNNRTSYSDNHQYVLVADTAETSVAWTCSSGKYGNILAAFREMPTSSITTVGASKDNYLRKAAATTNYGTAETMELIQYSTTNICKPILSFDFSSLIPAGATIVDAALRLFPTTIASSNAHSLSCYRVRRADWSETTSTWTAYKTDNNWSTAGAVNTTNDIDTTDAAAFTVPSLFSWLVWDVKNQVQTALDSTSGIAHFLIVDETSENSTIVICSREYATDTLLRPRLDIAYTVPSSSIKSVNGLLKASVSVINGLAIASVKTWNGLA